MSSGTEPDGIDPRPTWSPKEIPFEGVVDGGARLTSFDRGNPPFYEDLMARPLRYKAAGPFYHVMARGDGGKPVFEDDKDRFGWLDLQEKPVSGLAGVCMPGC